VALEDLSALVVQLALLGPALPEVLVGRDRLLALAVPEDLEGLAAQLYPVLSPTNGASLPIQAPAS